MIYIILQQKILQKKIFEFHKLLKTRKKLITNKHIQFTKILCFLFTFVLTKNYHYIFVQTKNYHIHNCFFFK